ncbi:L-seryl-tRNA(Sec) selenium transferase [Desulfosporosinus meridiei]|uniref:L-seryl-tRNA(Sec) selenium transferase n=1 Tax=Desulfosporosinus meridiei (strain ATCC BAA-275 / DSM 13257 / KCTC 12902 / NCIMB 13706 / S10) TaxID=768704 RepID=J7J008_DESMD|nr:L-seryl-tRNA(Sec) selenium transferase [Desulfosporosinus meridiei]AFQ45719.1 seryl-tRNA(Sec) selenium transferase [Desulfosporosinus meridiei DSM 13257]
MEQEILRRLRALPAVHEVLSRLEDEIEFSPFMANEGWTPRVTLYVRQVLQSIREDINRNYANPFEEFEAALWPAIKKDLFKKLIKGETSLRRVINATGVVLHTNCGRALLAPEVARFISEQAERYSNLELNIQTGERGSRYVHVEELLCKLTGAEAAMVVNNNAAAVLLMMNTFAQGKEVIVSRGELVEVGGSFRIPEVLKAGGAKLVEVGATNKTWLKDYEAAISSETAMLLKVHTSNYRVEGFTHTVSGAELVKLGEDKGLPVMEDLGSGSFFDGANLGFPPEPTIKQTVKAGISLVTFSGDKLLGGPQAGIIVGKKSFVQQLRTNQLTRALRVDKLTLAALEGTLRLYDKGEFNEIPVWRMLSAPLDKLYEAAFELFTTLQPNQKIEVKLQEDVSQVGGGAWPTVELPTWVCTIRPRQGSVIELEKFLRLGSVAILSRIHKNWIVIDVRTFLKGDREEVVRRLAEWDQ